MHAQKTILGPENKNTLKSLSSSSKIYLLNLFLQPHSSFGGNFLHGRDGKKRRRQTKCACKVHVDGNRTIHRLETK